MAVVGVLFVNWIVDASILRCLYTRMYLIFDDIRPPRLSGSLFRVYVSFRVFFESFFESWGGGLWCRVFVVFVECL